MAEVTSTLTPSYQTLDPSLKQIRLLHVDPNPSDLTAVLQTVSLETDPQYIALSYTWGYEMSSGAGIALFGAIRQPITFNLQIILEHLCADSDDLVTLWIDTLCINQADVAEKSHQITLMKDVYSKAEATCV